MQAIKLFLVDVKNVIHYSIAGGLLFFASSVGAAVNAPSGFKQLPLMPGKNTVVDCPSIPTPFTSSLIFTSKYEGTDDASSVINPDALDTYLEQTDNMIELQRLLADLSNKYLRSGNVHYRSCALDMLVVWAQGGAMLSESTNHTGAAVRKWTLAAIGAAYAKLTFSAADSPAINIVQKQLIEKWLSQLAEMVVTDYKNNPLNKVNNHDYWAAWAVGITAASLNRADLLSWSHDKFIQAMGQIDEKTGMLPNELKRKSLALSYHHYAIQPLVSLALLLKENGYDVLSQNKRALERLVNVTLRATIQPEVMEEVAGAKQKTDKLLSSTGLSWLEPWLVLKPNANIPLRWQQLRPLTSSRLGGDLTLIYAAKYVEKSNSYLTHPRPPLLNQFSVWSLRDKWFIEKRFAFYRRNIKRATPLI